MKRHLAAIVALDVVGYSRLMGRDEAGTLAVLKAQRVSLIEPKAAQYGGRIIKLMGDGALLEFSSAVGAVAFAVEVQCALRDAEQATGPRLTYRIGINIGDVIAEGDDIYGDGVNVAARLEGQAEPGGICLAGNVYEQVREKLELGFEALGSRSLKNIAEPVRVYRVALDDRAAALVTPVAPVYTPRRWPRFAVLAAAVALCAAELVWWHPWAMAPAPSATDPGHRAALPAPDRPRLAVLPFANISDDPAQDYFADGMTEDLITDLSKLSHLSVLAHTTTAGFKGKQVDPREIGRSLGARYVIEGSVRKAGGRVRINAQLVDAASGAQLWGDRYDGTLDHIFDLQDRVLAKITGSLALELSDEERRRLTARGTTSVAAHDLYLRGLYKESGFTRQGGREAMDLYRQALAIDPDYALPYTGMANILELGARNGWSDDVTADLERAVQLAEKAARLDPNNPRIQWSLGRAVVRLREPGALERGIAAMQRAIELDPDFADAYAYLAVLYVGAGRAGDGLRSVQTAMRLNPHYPFWYLFMRGITRYVVADYEAAIADFEAASERSQNALFVRWWLAAAYAQAGRTDDAEWQLEEMQTMGFKGTVSTIMDTQPIRDPTYLARYRAGLVKAGIPE